MNDDSHVKEQASNMDSDTALQKYRMTKKTDQGPTSCHSVSRAFRTGCASSNCRAAGRHREVLKQEPRGFR